MSKQVPLPKVAVKRFDELGQNGSLGQLNPVANIVLIEKKIFFFIPLSKLNAVYLRRALG